MKAEDFYEHLMAFLGHMQRADELVVLGDFNARVGCDAALGIGELASNARSAFTWIVAKCKWVESSTICNGA